MRLGTKRVLMRDSQPTVISSVCDQRDVDHVLRPDCQCMKSSLKGSHSTSAQGFVCVPQSSSDPRKKSPMRP